jgi:hypothetical protein
MDEKLQILYMQMRMVRMAAFLDAKSRFWWDGPEAVKDFYREEVKRRG